jgi:hypothetical protein
VIFWLAFSLGSPSSLTSLMTSSRSQTNARLGFTWLAKHPML